MAAMLHNIAIGFTHPRYMLLAMLTMEMELHGFLFLCMCGSVPILLMMLHLAALWAAGALLRVVPFSPSPSRMTQKESTRTKSHMWQKARSPSYPQDSHSNFFFVLFFSP